MDSKFCLVLIAALASCATSLRVPRPNGNGVKVVDEADNQAPCFCRLNYSPVCGSDGNSYSNDCTLKCAGKHLTVEHQGTCETNPTIVNVPSVQGLCGCPRNSKPVCGSDGETYENQCLLECSGKSINVRHNGPCSDEVKVVDSAPSCTHGCTADYTPVCGTDGKTYSNECSMRCAADVQVSHQGQCDDSVKVVDNVAPNDKCTCTRNYRPVCGNDGVTYSNQCLMRCAGQELKFGGPCDGNQVRVVE